MVTQTILRIVEIQGCRMAVKAVSTDSSFHITGAYIAGADVLPILGIGARAKIFTEVCKELANQCDIFDRDEAEMYFTQTVKMSA